MKNSIKLVAFALTAFIISSCSKNENKTPPPVNEEEVITTVSVTLQGGGQTIVLTSKDLDGIDGPNAPVFSTTGGNLVAGRTYSGLTTFKNELKSPAEDITVEVEEEGDAHQIFYQLASNLGLVTYNDLDKNGKPIGLIFNLVAGTKGSKGNLIVTLKHEPNKSASGVASGDITNAGGATDAWCSLPLVVE